MKELLPELREYLNLIERDTLLDRSQCCETVKLAQDLVMSLSRDANSETSEIEYARRFLNSFNQIFCQESLHSQEQISSLQTVCASLSIRSVTGIIARLTLAKLTTLTDTENAIPIFLDLIEAADSINDNYLRVVTRLRAARTYIYMGTYDAAFPLCFEAQTLFQQARDPWSLDALIHYHLALCFVHFHSPQKALPYFLSVLTLYRQHNSFYFIAYTLQSLAIAYVSASDNDNAIECYRECVEIAEKHQFQELAAHALSNLGSTYASLGEYEKACESIERAQMLFDDSKDDSARAANQLHLALLYGEKQYASRDDEKAQRQFDEALHLAEKAANKHLLSNIYSSRHGYYLEQEQWQKALEDYKRYVELDREVFTSDIELRVRSMEQDHERKLVLNEQRITSTLLHKVFPAAVVERMKHEQRIADSFECVTVMFADIVGFTPLGSSLSPTGVISLLNNVFGIFDAVMKKYGCEKIKTIGDGYMAVAGAPVSTLDHAERMVLAAVELQRELKGFTTSRAMSAENVPLVEDHPLYFRIGLHCGPVVAGVVGEERFVYDLYGDTVNTAARMESHGDPGRIHISNDLLHHVLRRHESVRDTLNGEAYQVKLEQPVQQTLRFVARGDVDVKGKGRMQTYYVEALD